MVSTPFKKHPYRNFLAFLAGENMFVKFMSADAWQDRVDHGLNLVAPTWIQVCEAILALDGISRTMVCLSQKEGDAPLMMIAGQWAGRCLVNATQDNMDFFSIVDPSQSTEKQALFIGGQDGDFEGTRCVPFAWAMEAAKCFFESGELKPSMNWQSDD